MPKIPHSAVTAGMFPLQFLLLSSRYQLKNENALVSAILHFSILSNYMVRYYSFFISLIRCVVYEAMN